MVKIIKLMKKFFFKRLNEDHGSWLVHKIDNLSISCFILYSNFVVRFISFFRNVKFGKECKFFGIPHFRRSPFSIIQMGHNCTLRSDHTSNLIGVNHKCIFSTHHKDAVIIIGDNCGFSGATLGAAKEIRIGNNVLVGANTIITDFDWHSDRSNTQPESVVIHDNVWIGVNSTILKGVTIGMNSIIGANSLVVKDIPANVIAGGNPCKVLKPIL
jgi:carbonic anhydrase/acetyltransferase-like protein (isoleucine patch superfamily)